MQKIDYTNKHGIMVGYIDRSDNVVAVETGWKTTPEVMAKFLLEKHPTKDEAIKLVDSPVLLPMFKKDDYEYVDGFGDVIESNLSSKALILRLSHGCLWPGLAVYVRVVARRSKTWVLRKEEIVQDVVENPNYRP